MSVCLSLSKLLIPPMPSIPAMMGQSSCQSSFGGITLSSSSIDKRFPNNSVPQTAITNSVPQTKKYKQIEILHKELIKGQLEINKEEAKSGSIFIAGWRPAIGWIGVFAMAYQFVLYPFLVWGTELVIAVWGTELFGNRLSIEELERVIPPKLDWQLLWPIIAGMLGIGGMRSFDKLKHTDTKKISKK